ncbi:MAG: AAA family ATPase [Flavobacteriaceae bacterium]|nr:AAA family ATPase [Flavobacteriaceae bacterium]
MENKYLNFKKILEYFVAHLEYLQNNESSDSVGYNTYIEPLIKQDTFYKSGQGYKGGNIQKVINRYSNFKNGTICINIQPNYGSYTTKKSYLNWAGTGLNIIAEWNSDNIKNLFLLEYIGEESKKRIDLGYKKTIEQLGLFDNNEPNDNLKSFFDEFETLIIKWNENNEKNKKMEKILPYIELLKNNKNLIFTGAPGTGKTYLAKQIAREMIGLKDDENLEDSEQFEFVQFHPSYDYTDFVEGLRPVKEKEQKEIGFELKDGIFKKFCEKALTKIEINLTEDIKEKYLKFILDEKNEGIYNSYIDDFCIDLENKQEKKYIKDVEYIISPFYIDNEEIFYIAKNKDNELRFSCAFHNNLFQKTPPVIDPVLSKEKARAGDYNYYIKWHIVLEYCIKNYNLNILTEWLNENNYKIEDYIKYPNDTKYVFIIDEINRAEISKVFGELFFSIDPGYRGKKGIVKTQYHNLVESRDNSYVFKKGFFIPENVYIIGTMNDIDRSVESIDFAMRRRFAWQEVTPKDTMAEMFEKLDDRLKEKAKDRLNRLNEKIKDDKELRLGAEYQIGGAYFLKLNNYINYDNPWDKLWDNHLKGVLSEYLRGFPDDDKKKKLKKLKGAYNLK